MTISVTICLEISAVYRLIGICDATCRDHVSEVSIEREGERGDEGILPLPHVTRKRDKKGVFCKFSSKLNGSQHQRHLTSVFLSADTFGWKSVEVSLSVRLIA